MIADLPPPPTRGERVRSTSRDPRYMRDFSVAIERRVGALSRATRG